MCDEGYMKGSDQAQSASPSKYQKLNGYTIESSSRWIRRRQQLGRIFVVYWMLLSILLTSNFSINSNINNEQYYGMNNGSQCSILHNISKYEGSNKHTQLPTKHLDQCLFFTCSKNETLCDNVIPTDYDGPHPPCCSHILRDMARTFDEEMCRLGLDYTAGFGTLLGLERGNKFIPWTIDHDYIIESNIVADAMVDLWDAKVTGIAHVYHGGMNRMCITADFANGRLSYWTNKFFFGSTISQSDYDNLWMRNHPYIDIYVGKNISQSVFQEIRPCLHYYSDVFPTKRRLVYEGTFYQNFPAKPEQMLRVYYGKNWRVPIDNKNPHGFNESGGTCPKRFQIPM